MELDHIEPKNEGGTDDIDNAIPVCFECHAEIHSYNDQHPRGRKFQPDELRKHKDQWIKICKDTPELLLRAARDSDVGPIQSLIDELEFNIEVSNHLGYNELGCKLRNDEFSRALRLGSISILQEELKDSLIIAYRAIGSANHFLELLRGQSSESTNYNNAYKKARDQVEATKEICINAHQALITFLSSDK